MATELDYMEYASDALAQTAYADEGTFTSDLCNGGTAYEDDHLYTLVCANAFANDDSTTFWVSANTGAGGYTWIAYNLVTAKRIERVKVLNRTGYANLCFKNFKIQGSNDSTNGSDGTWTDLATGLNTAGTDQWNTFDFINGTAYSWIRLYGQGQAYSGSYYVQVAEIEMMENVFQCYSESSIKTQGSYALKGIAVQTDSLNKTLTRTIGSPIDLSGVDSVTFQIRSNRTGSNIKVGIHDSGGTTTEVTPNILSADTFQEVTIDLSGVADANKDAIDSIIITIANADSANTFYIDNFLSAEAENVTVTAEPFIVTTSLSSSGGVVIAGYGYVYEQDTTGAVMDVAVRTKAKVGKGVLKRKNLKYIYHMMNTHGKDITMTIYVDGEAQTPTFTVNTTERKMVRIEDVPNFEGYKFDIRLTGEDLTDNDLEIYGHLALQHTVYGE